MQALQRVADANGGNRASGTSGYEESARYVEEQLRAAGYAPVRQAFTFKEDGRRGKTVESFNILADTGGDAGHTVVVGAHLDSVQKDPGIDDNGSGVAAVLETTQWDEGGGRDQRRSTGSGSRSRAGRRTASTGPSTTSTSSARPRSARPR